MECNYHKIVLRNSKGNKGTYCPSCLTDKYYREPQPMKTARNKFLRSGRIRWTKEGVFIRKVNSSGKAKVKY